MMAIPTEICSKINPDFKDPISKSIIYTFTAKDKFIDNQGCILYKFPYSKNTYWTNFKYNCYKGLSNQAVPVEIGIQLETTDKYTYCLQMIHEREPKVWYDTEWPLPSVYTEDFKAGLYFKIKLPADGEDYSLSISLLGFMDLFPDVKNYLLLSMFDTYQFIIHKNEEDGNQEGKIWNVENNIYIQNYIGSACGIRLIKRY